MTIPQVSDELLATLRFAVDKVALAQAQEAVQSLKNGYVDTQNAAERAKKQVIDLGKTAASLKQLGQTSLIFGGAILGPLGIAAKTYLAQAGEATEESLRWAAAMDSIKESTARVGGVVVDQVLPYLEKAAELAEKASKFVEDHPEVIEAALKIGTSAVVLGTVANAAGTLAASILSIQKLGILGKLGSLTAKGGALAAGSAGAAALGVGGSILGGVVGGAGYYDLMNNLTGNTRDSSSDIIKKTLVIQSYAAGWLIGGKEKADALALAMGKLTGTIEQAEDATDGVDKGLSKIVLAQMEAYAKYAEEDQAATAKYNEKKISMAKDFAMKQAQAEEDYIRSRDKAIRDFRVNEAKTERDYYRERMKQAKDYGKEVQRAEEDHQRDLLRSQIDHKTKMWDLAADRDTGGLVDEMRAYEESRRRSEEDHAVEMSRKSEDFAQELKENEVEFQISREQRMVAFQQQLADTQTEYNVQRDRARKQYNENLRELNDSYNRERILRREAIKGILDDIKAGGDAYRKLVSSYTQAMIAEFNALTGNKVKASQLSSGQKASGGYVHAGMWQLHDREFVMNADVTTAAERAAGGRLNSSNLMELLSGGRNLTYQDNRSFQTKLSSEERRAIRRDTTVLLGELIHG